MNISNLSIDKQDMHGEILTFPFQILESLQIAEHFDFIEINRKFKKVVLLGMGGSAIAGDLIKSLFFHNTTLSKCEFVVNRDYHLNTNIDSNTLVIASSYSGNTEETISAFEEAKKFTNNIIVLTTGGKLFLLAKDYKLPFVILPKDLQPRAALGFSFFTLLLILIDLNIFKKQQSEKIMGEIEPIFLNSVNKLINFKTLDKNDKAYKLAYKIKNKIPIFYSSGEILSGVNLRFRGQIQENSNHLAFGGILPEMNHNEINAWDFPKGIKENFIIFFLDDKAIEPRIRERIKITSEYLSTKVEVQILQGEGDTAMQRVFDLILLADRVSYYLAILNECDPTEIKAINFLKERLKHE